MPPKNEFDPFEMTATGGDFAPKDQIDWTAIQSAVLAKLDIAAEYREMGLKLTHNAASQKGWIDCHAIDRDDENPSAGINVQTGWYVDHGGAGAKMDFFQFAVKHGGHGRWSDALKHYAEKAGVVIGKFHAKSKGRIHETTYHYREEDGSVRYGVFRYKLPTGDKTFTQHPPDGKGGWKFGDGCMDGVEPLPYRLPEIVNSPDEPIWISEGEKDCDRLASLGLIATTNHGGCKNTEKTWPKFVERFAGRTCYILPHNDAAGREHARKVAALLAPVAKLVKVISLGKMHAKGDVSDWIDMGNGASDLRLLADLAPEFDPATPPQAEDIKTLAEKHLPKDEDVVTVCFNDVEAVPVEWLWPNRVAKNKVTLFAGEAKQGKSFLTIDMAARVSNGGIVPCGNGECMPMGSVLFLSAEDDLDDTMKPRLMACGADVSKIHAFTGVRNSDGREGMFDLSQIFHLERAIMRLGDCQLVVIDPITAYIGGKIDDHKASALRSVLGPLKDLAKRQQVAIVVVTHHNKSNTGKALTRVTGSGAYTALARSNWLIMKDPKDPKRRLFLSASTNLVEDPDGLAYRIDSTEKRVVWEEMPIAMTADDLLDEEREQKTPRTHENASKVEQAEAWLLDLLSGGKEVPSEEILTQGEAKGFSRKVLFAAKKRTSIKARKASFSGAWHWYDSQESPGGRNQNEGDSWNSSDSEGTLGTDGTDDDEDDLPPF